MAGNSKPLSNSQPAIGALQVQTSAHGQAAALFWGRVRVPPNLLSYDDFAAIPRTETQGGGGKGGGAKQTTTTYTYQAAVVMSLGVGPVNGVLSVWRAKERLYGASTSSRIRTLRHSATVPGGGVVTPPESGNHYRNVAVRHLTNDSAGKGIGAAHAGVLTEGVDYTVSGGNYTLVAAWVGLQVEIEYQIQEAVAGTSALGQLGLSLATGVHSQPVWAHLTSNHPAKAIAYPGLAYLYGATFSLDTNAQVPNHTFEVSTPSEFSASIPDADMSRVVEEFLTDGLRGVQWPQARLGDLTHFRNYCRAWGLFMSPALLEQERAADTLKRWLKLCNADCTWSGQLLKVVPLGDEDKTANGATYSADITPIYDLTSADFLIEGDQPRITVTPRVNEDAYNHVRVEFQNRANGYAIEVMSAKDLAHIEQFGERTMEVIKAHEVKTPEVASFVAHIELQRQMSIWNSYRFKLPWQKGRLEPLDLVTLTDPDLYLHRVPVRITRITEGADDFTVEAEDCPFGHASAPLYGAQAGDGYAPDFNAPPGDALAPVIFELPGLLTASGLELAVATAGATEAWGGCQVWVSFDEVNYKEIAELRGSSRFGTLTAPVGSTLALQLAAGQLVTASAEDAAALSTLLFVGGASPEYLAYETATLTGPGAYTLGGLERGAYGSTPDPHNTGDPVVRVDTAIARSGPLDPALIGKTIHIKLPSFNVFGGALQSLSEVDPIPYTITGAFVTGGNGGAELLILKSTGFAFIFPSSAATSSDSPTIEFTAEIINIVGTVTFEATAYDAANAVIGTVGGVTLTDITATGCKLTAANFNALGATTVRYVGVTATLGTLSDTMTVYRGDEGGDALNLVLDNEAHVVPTDSAGTNGIFTGATTGAQLYEGITDVTSLWAFAITFSNASGTINGGAGPVGPGVGTVTVACTALSADRGTITITATRAGYPTQAKVFSLAKSKAGIAGVDSELVFARATPTAIRRNKDATFTPNAIVFEILEQIGSGAPAAHSTYWSFYKGTGTTSITWGTPIQGNSSQYSGQSNLGTSLDGTHTAMKFEVFADSGRTQLLDVITVPILNEGSDGMTGYLTNESHNVPADAAGTVSSYSGASGTFKVFRGAVDVTASCTFSVASYSGFASTPSAPTNGTGAYSVTGSPAMNADVATITYRASYTHPIQGALTLDKVFTLTKSKQGTQGSTGGTGSAGTRGSLNLYISGSSPLTSTECDNAVLSATGSSAKVLGDTVTESNGSTYVASLRWNGSSWVAPGTVIDGSLLVNGSVSAIALAAASVAADKITSSTTPTNGIAFALGSSASVAGYNGAGAFISSTNARYGLLVANTTSQTGAGGIAVGVVNGSSYAGTFVNSTNSNFNAHRTSVDLAENERAGWFRNYTTFPTVQSEVYLCETGNAIEIKTGMFRYDRTLESGSGGGTATFTGTKPGSAQNNTWLRINCNGTDYVLPIWPAA